MNGTTQETKSAQSETPETGCRETKLGSVEISENFNAEPPFTGIFYRIPMQIQTFFIDEELNRYEEVLTSDLQLKAQFFFELIDFLGSLLYQGDYDSEKIGEYVHTLGAIGKGLALASEEVTREFKWHSQKQTEAEAKKPPSTVEAESRLNKPTTPKKTTLMMSDRDFYQPLADRLTLLLDSGKLPMEVRDSLYSIVDTAITESSINADNDYYVRQQFPKAMAALKTDYARGLYHSLISVLENGVDEELYDSVVKQTEVAI